MTDDNLRPQNWRKRIADWSERLVDTVVGFCTLFPANKRNELVPLRIRAEQQPAVRRHCVRGH